MCEITVWYKCGVKIALTLRRYAAPFLMGILPAALLALIGDTGSFTRYIADDYCSADWAQRFGLFRSVWHWYITWSGRFSAYASDWFVVQMGARNVGIVPPVMLALWIVVTVAAVYLFLRRVRYEADDWILSLVLGVVFLFAVLTSVPSIETSFYWWNGMRSYTLPLLMLTLFAAVYQYVVGRLVSRPRVIAASLFSFAFLFVNAGLSDVYAVTQLGLLALLTILNFVSREKKQGAFAVSAAGVLGTVLALVVIVLSPGNPVREASFPAHPGLLRLLAIGWQGYSTLLQSILLQPEKLLALVGVMCAAAWAGTRTKQLRTGKWTASALLAMGLVLSYGAFLPGSWGLSEPPPPRNISVPVFFLVAGLSAAAFVGGSRLSMRKWSAAAARTVVVIAILSLNISAGIGIRGAYAARQTYIQYARNWDAEEAVILAAKSSGAATVTVPAWPNWANLDVLSEHSKNWLNQCTSGYYDIEVIGRAP